MTQDQYSNYCNRRSALNEWINDNGGINLHPTRTVGETANAAQAAGVSISIEEIIAAQDFETEILGW